MKRRYGVVLKEYVVRAIQKWLPERQLILRTDGHIRYVKFSQNLQIALCSTVFIAFAWGAFTSVTYFLFDDILRSKDAQISTAHNNYRNLLNEVSQYQARFSLLTKELQQNHAMMLDLVENNATLQLNLRSAQKNLETSRVQQSEINAAKNALREKLASIEGELNSLNGRNFELRGNLASVTNDLQSVLNERDQAHAMNRTLKTQVAQLENEVHELHLTETEVVERLADRTQEGIAFMERVFARAGLDADEFLAQLAQEANEAPVGSREDESEVEASDEVVEQNAGEELAVAVDDVASVEKEPEIPAQTPGIEMTIVRRSVGQGGPFIAAPRQSRPESGEKLKASLSDLEERLGRWDDLRQLMRSAPLPAPLDEFQISSSFGKRRDPIRGRLSMHYGLDLRAPMGSQVYATAPGVVTIASAQNEYGRLVEIDHGMGFKTRYAHLKKILVKAGQKVDYRDKIGLLGNSGRSTGPHLHYEIAHNGRPVDPMRFLKAGKYVYKGQ